MCVRHWLMKSEPDEFSIEDLVRSPRQETAWFGVRNYQARNFMRDAMRVGDGVLFYHSSCDQPGIVGLARVASAPYPDPTQFDPTSPYYDARATPAEPRWQLVDVQVLRKTRPLTLPALRAHAELAELVVLRKGNRLSITPVEARHWQTIVTLLA